MKLHRKAKAPETPGTIVEVKQSDRNSLIKYIEEEKREIEEKENAEIEADMKIGIEKQNSKNDIGRIENETNSNIYVDDAGIHGIEEENNDKNEENLQDNDETELESDLDNNKDKSVYNVEVNNINLKEVEDEKNKDSDPEDFTVEEDVGDEGNKVENYVIGEITLDDDNMSAMRITRQLSSVSTDVLERVAEEDEESLDDVATNRNVPNPQIANPFADDNENKEETLNKSGRNGQLNYSESIFTNGKVSNGKVTNGVLESHFGYDDRKNPFLEAFED